LASNAKYTELGECLNRLAERRNIRGPYNVAKFVRERTGEGPIGSSWSQIFRGETARPQPATLHLFVEAFELTEEEKRKLADVYLFGD
jgi:hypothetical protein